METITKKATRYCLDPNKDVLMYDGTIKKVKDVEAQDLLAAVNSKPWEIKNKESDTLNELLRVAKEEAPKMCEAFPHLICNEVKGLKFDNWCEPCQARAVLEAFKLKIPEYSEV